MNIFRPEYLLSSVKCFRYQYGPPAIEPSPPPDCWLMNVSVSFYVCGILTFGYDASSKFTG